MKEFLAFLFSRAAFRVRGTGAFHDDSLRANQGGPAASFGPWRALVGGNR